MHMVKSYDPSYSKIMWIILNERCTATLFEDNTACIAQIAGDYIKGDRIKHILSKFFYTHEL